MKKKVVDINFRTAYFFCCCCCCCRHCRQCCRCCCCCHCCLCFWSQCCNRCCCCCCHHCCQCCRCCCCGLCCLCFWSQCCNRCCCISALMSKTSLTKWKGYKTFFSASLSHRTNKLERLSLYYIFHALLTLVWAYYRSFPNLLSNARRT